MTSKNFFQDKVVSNCFEIGMSDILFLLTCLVL